MDIIKRLAALSVKDLKRLQKSILKEIVRRKQAARPAETETEGSGDSRILPFPGVKSTTAPTAKPRRAA